MEWAWGDPAPGGVASCGKAALSAVQEPPAAEDSSTQSPGRPPWFSRLLLEPRPQGQGSFAAF